MTIAEKEQKYTNRLIRETSPYLLQHAHNPVDWFPWGRQAFEAAQNEDKPIFLSIGYSTCHWCHIMEQESFTNERIAEIMNENFINIKVDREQHPEVDDTYMKAVQAMTGSGGWPLSVFLTPHGRPFFGGTYFPEKDMYGRSSFDKILLAVAMTWKSKRDEVLKSAGNIKEIIESSQIEKKKKQLSLKILENASLDLINSFDSTYGGFGQAPKFPQATALSLLLNYWFRTKQDNAIEVVEFTLNAMSKGGIYDQIGGGFHRYSTDQQWLVPHFEKMLYDQALLSRTYIHAYQVTGKEQYAQIARGILDYVLRDMTDKAGGFYSAEDADSEGCEGKFYIWQPDQIKEILGTKGAEIFNAYYGITAEGNFESGKNILNITVSKEELAERFGKDLEQIEEILTGANARLLKEREKRPRPYRDDKIITGWNGMMISSFASVGSILGEEKYIAAASNAAEFFLNILRQKGRLMRYYRAGQAVDLAFLDDYAFMSLCLLDLYEATFVPQWLAEARNLIDQMIELFTDENNGAFFMVGKDAEHLTTNYKPSYDTSIPSGNSAAALALAKIGKLTFSSKFSNIAKQIIDDFSESISKSPTSFSNMLIAQDFLLGPTQEIIITGDIEQVTTKEMLKITRKFFLPNSLKLFRPSGTAGQTIDNLIPFLKELPKESKTCAYFCENYTCRKPSYDVKKFEEILIKISKGAE